MKCPFCLCPQNIPLESNFTLKKRPSDNSVIDHVVHHPYRIPLRHHLLLTRRQQRRLILHVPLKDAFLILNTWILSYYPIFAPKKEATFSNSLWFSITRACAWDNVQFYCFGSNRGCFEGRQWKGAFHHEVKCPYLLVAGEGLEHSTSGLWIRWRYVSQTIE